MCCALLSHEKDAEEGIVRYLSNLYEVQNKDKALFDAIEYESEVEKQFAMDLDNNENVRLFAKDLNDRDRQILEQRVLAEPPRTLAEMGEEFGVSRERVRQVEAKLLSRLRAFMKEKMVDFDFYAAPDED